MLPTLLCNPVLAKGKNCPYDTCCHVAAKEVQGEAQLPSLICGSYESILGYKPFFGVESASRI